MAVFCDAAAATATATTDGCRVFRLKINTGAHNAMCGDTAVTPRTRETQNAVEGGQRSDTLNLR